MTEDHNGFGGHASGEDDLIEIDLNFESMRRFQAEFSPNLSRDGLFIDTGEPLTPGSVVRFRVILPEEFVFLEGTSVVEWSRGPEVVTDGAPGMALRFVTLSPQNQELVEQLVQDHLGGGGSSFDLDVRPVPGDFPTDALEGAPRLAGPSAEEGYRLTVRQTGPNLQAEALKALSLAVPGGEDEESEPAPETDSHENGDAQGFEIVSNTPGREDEDAIDEEVGIEDREGGEVEEAGEPPALDWSFEIQATDEPEMDPDGTEDEPEGVINRINEGSDDDSSFDRDFIQTPTDYDVGPEVIEDVGNEDLGSPAFDVSLPDSDDGPDMTQVLSDEQQNSDTVSSEAEEEEGPKPRRLWPLALVAIFVLAVGGGFLWPQLKAWNDARMTASPPDQEGVVVVEPAAIVNLRDDQQPAPDESEGRQSTDESSTQARMGEGGFAVKSESAQSATIPSTASVGETDGQAWAVNLGRADTVTAIEVGPGQRGTVIRIHANGSLEDGVISVENLSSPPRVLVRVRGIETEYRPYNIESLTPEVVRVRNGHHEEQSPPELWVVLDLAGSGIALDGIDIQADTAELLIVRD